MREMIYAVIMRADDDEQDRFVVDLVYLFDLQAIFAATSTNVKGRRNQNHEAAHVSSRLILFSIVTFCHLTIISREVVISTWQFRPALNQISRSSSRTVLICHITRNYVTERIVLTPFPLPRKQKSTLFDSYVQIGDASSQFFPPCDVSRLVGSFDKPASRPARQATAPHPLELETPSIHILQTTTHPN